jgi:hypothetical protein
MLMIQPFEMIVLSADQIAIRCHTNNGDRQFLINSAEEFSFGALELLTSGDHSELEFERSVDQLLAAKEGMYVAGKGLLFPFSVQALDEIIPQRYRVTFRSDNEEVEQVYTVYSGLERNSVTGGERSWTASMNVGGRLTMDEDSKAESHLARALLYLDMARNAEYGDDVLKMREKKIDWEMVQAQHERNVQRRRELDSMTQEEFEKRYYRNVMPTDDSCSPEV